MRFLLKDVFFFVGNIWRFWSMWGGIFGVIFLLFNSWCSALRNPQFLPHPAKKNTLRHPYGWILFLISSDLTPGQALIASFPQLLVIRTRRVAWDGREHPGNLAKKSLWERAPKRVVEKTGNLFGTCFFVIFSGFTRLVNYDHLNHLPRNPLICNFIMYRKTYGIPGT